jgi:hypothetical protein
MKTYELNAGDIDLALTALRFTAEHGYTYEIEHGGDLTDYHDMKALIKRLEPKPVKKKAWMVVYADESRSRLFDYETDAKEWAKNTPDKFHPKVIKVTWEE